MHGDYNLNDIVYHLLFCTRFYPNRCKEHDGTHFKNLSV